MSIASLDAKLGGIGHLDKRNLIKNYCGCILNFCSNILDLLSDLVGCDLGKRTNVLYERKCLFGS